MNQSSPSEYGVSPTLSTCTSVPPSRTANVAAPTPTRATRRLWSRRTATVPMTNAATSPNSSRVRANPGV